MVIVERYCSPTGGGLQDGTSEANAWTWVQAVAGVVAGQRVNVTGSHTLIADSTVSTSATTNAPIIWRGYGSIIGDGVEATLNFGTGFRLIITGSTLTFDRIGVTSDSAAVVELGGTLIVFMRGTVTNTGSSGSGLFISTSGVSSKVIGCSIKCQNAPNSYQAGVRMSTDGSAFYNTIHSTGDGIMLENSFRHYRVANNLIVGNGGSTGSGIWINSVGGTQFIEAYANTIYNFAQGIRMAQSTAFLDSAIVEMMNNIIYSCVNGIENDSAVTQEIGMTIANNAMGALSGSRYVNFGDIPILDDEIVLTADPFTNAAGLDFSLNDVAGGGLLVKGKGIGAPAVTP